MNAVIYARYSAGPRQTEQSIEGQLRVCSDFCKQRGLTVVGTYCDRHISGKTDQRPKNLLLTLRKRNLKPLLFIKLTVSLVINTIALYISGNLSKTESKSFTQRKLFLTALKALSLRALWKVLPNITLRNSHKKFSVV